MNILVTGAKGFVARNFIANLPPHHTILTFDKDDSVDSLKGFAQNADIVFHLAGVNRPTEISEFQTGNADLTKQLLDVLIDCKKNIPVVLSSSIQAELDNPYGQSKKLAEEEVFSYAKETGAAVYVYRFPNVFGKFSKPNYNSVVSTFCYNVANGIDLQISDQKKEMTLLYIDDIVFEFLRILENKVKQNNDEYCYCEPTKKITLGELAQTIQGFQDSRTSLINGDRQEAFMRKLYATYLSYLPQDKFSVLADMKKDSRGFFAELIKSPHFGQISVSRTKVGVTRGNHWHNTKVEKFIVIEGEALISFRKIDAIDGNETFEYRVSGEQIEMVDIPPGYTHNIKNIGDCDLITIFWAGELFEPENPDTYFMEV